jgi:hypothetical protein
LNPIDAKNMNRTYPGRADGTQSERASLAITKEVVERCDHLIDLYGGDLDERLRPYSYWTRTGREPQDRISRELVLVVRARPHRRLYRAARGPERLDLSGEHRDRQRKTLDHRRGRP